LDSTFDTDALKFFAAIFEDTPTLALCFRKQSYLH